MLILFLNIVFISTKNVQAFGDMPAGPPNFIFKSFTDCAEGKTSSRLIIVPKWINESYQVLNGNFSTTLPFGDNLLTHISANILIRDKSMHVANISTTLCSGLRNYVGPIRNDIMRSIGLLPDTCPIPKGNYHFNNLHLDWKKSRVPTFPYGYFKIVLNFNEKRTHALELCLQIELENKSQ